jgi:hypothetical protein
MQALYLSPCLRVVLKGLVEVGLIVPNDSANGGT